MKFPFEYKFTRSECMCNKCNHIFLPRTAKPQRCPKCRSWFDETNICIVLNHEHIDIYTIQK